MSTKTFLGLQDLANQQSMLLMTKLESPDEKSGKPGDDLSLPTDNLLESFKNKLRVIVKKRVSEKRQAYSQVNDSLEKNKPQVGFPEGVMPKSQRWS